jgi:hypothetical protein
MSFGPALSRFIRDTIGPLFGYAFHPGAVVAQASDGTVEVKPDSPVVPPQKGRPLRLGVPGIKVKVGPGTRVRLYFSGGSPEASEVALWEGDGLLELELDASVKVVINSPQVHLGGDSPPDSAIKGTTYRAAEDTLLTALSTYLGVIVAGLPVPAAVAPATTTYEAAVTAFKSGAHLSTCVKVKG